jgi:hypothetical protein
MKMRVVGGILRERPTQAKKMRDKKKCEAKQARKKKTAHKNQKTKINTRSQVNRRYLTKTKQRPFSTAATAHSTTERH